MNNILLIAATHGDEPIGVRALETLEQQRHDFDWIIGNPRAYEKNVRYTEADLNRSAPGSVFDTLYEKRRAAEILSLAKQYQTVMDLHGTEKQTGLFIIITNPTRENVDLATRLDVKRVVIWPAITPDLKSPLSEFFTAGLEIECGPKDVLETQRELERVINHFLDGQPSAKEQEFFEVYGELRGDPRQTLNEFEEVTIKGETFTPLLVGQYTDDYGVVCYKLRKISVEDLAL